MQIKPLKMSKKWAIEKQIYEFCPTFFEYFKITQTAMVW